MPTARKAALVVAMFLATLQSFYFYDHGGPVFSYLGAVVLIALGLVGAIRGGRPTPTQLAVWAALGLVAIGASLTTGNIKGSAGIIIGGGALALGSLAFRNSDEAARYIAAIIVAHLVLFWGQVVWHFAGLGYLDYLAPVTGEASRWNSSKGFQIGGTLVPRFTGAFNEPGSFSGVIGALLAARYATTRKADFIIAAGIASLVFTASLTGFVLAVVLLGAVALDWFWRIKSKAFQAVLGVLGGAFIAALLAFAAGQMVKRLSYPPPYTDAVVPNLQWLADPVSLSLFGHTVSSLPEYVSIEYFGLWMGTYTQFGVAGLTALLAAVAPVFLLNPLAGAAFLLAKIKVTFPLVFILLSIVWRRRSESLSTAETYEAR